MSAIALSPFFLLFCTTSATAAYLAHRRFVLRVKPSYRDSCLALLAGLQSLGLALSAYQIRLGVYATKQLEPTAASLIAALTGIGVTFVCIECALASKEAEATE